MKIHIQNGHVIDPAHHIDHLADVFIADGKILAIGETAPVGFTAEGILDASGCIVCPGLVDLSARLREPGFEYRATLESEMAAAVAGGVTSLACPPDTDPPLDEPGLVEMLKFRAKQLGCAHVYPVGALTVGLTGQKLTEMVELSEAGCIAFGQASQSIGNTQVLMRAMQYAATFGFPIWLQAQEHHLSRGGVAHDGEVSTRLGLTGIPVAAETIALATLLHLAKITKARLHITRISSAAAVEMIRAAKETGLEVTCDISAHHLHLTEHDIGWFDAHLRLDPPARSREDRDALRQGLADGTIDAVCSDHTPVDDDAKQLPFAQAEVGATGLELLLPLTLKWAADMDLPLSLALATITHAPARIMSIPAGTLTPGTAADLCVFDPKGNHRISRDTLKSQGRNTPFLDQTLPGRVRYTLIEGHLAYDGGAFG